MQTEQAAARAFGERLPLATQYAHLLATTGVERGLIGPREVGRIWDRHLLNCAVVQELLDDSIHVVDVGSGAGLPGVALALARPDLRVTLVEPLLRRATFLMEVVAQLGLDTVVHRGRAQEGSTRAAVGRGDVVVARAVAPLGTLVGWCLPLVRVDGRVLALKGRSAAEEIARDRGSVAQAGGGQLFLRECGAELLAQPTRVVEVVRESAHNRR